MKDKYKEWKHKHLKLINKIGNIILKTIGIIVLIDTIGFIVGILRPTLIGIITSYFMCAIICLFGEFNIENTKE